MKWLYIIFAVAGHTGLGGAYDSEQDCRNALEAEIKDMDGHPVGICFEGIPDAFTADRLSKRNP